MITLFNNFHDTQVSIQAEVGDVLTPSQYRRVRRELCGIRGCTCGIVRGYQDYALCALPSWHTFDGDTTYIVIEANERGMYAPI